MTESSLRQLTFQLIGGTYSEGLLNFTDVCIDGKSFAYLDISDPKELTDFDTVMETKPHGYLSVVGIIAGDSSFANMYIRAYVLCDTYKEAEETMLFTDIEE